MRSRILLSFPAVTIHAGSPLRWSSSVHDNHQGGLPGASAEMVAKEPHSVLPLLEAATSLMVE